MLLVDALVHDEPTTLAIEVVLVPPALPLASVEYIGSPSVDSVRGVNGELPDVFCDGTYARLGELAMTLSTYVSDGKLPDPSELVDPEKGSDPAPVDKLPLTSTLVVFAN